MFTYYDYLVRQQRFNQYWNSPSERPKPVYINHTSLDILLSDKTIFEAYIFILNSSQYSSSPNVVVHDPKGIFMALKAAQICQKSHLSICRLPVYLMSLYTCLTSPMLPYSFEALSQPRSPSSQTPHRRPPHPPRPKLRASGVFSPVVPSQFTSEAQISHSHWLNEEFRWFLGPQMVVLNSIQGTSIKVHPPSPSSIFLFLSSLPVLLSEFLIVFWFSYYSFLRLPAFRVAWRDG